MKNLVYYVPSLFTGETTRPDTKIWLGMFSLFDSISFIDRTGVIKSPYRMDTIPANQMPAYDPNFSMNFEECAVATAEEIYKKHLKFGVPIRLSWSGGIDSTCILMAFIQLLGMQKTKQCIDIVMTKNGITENPYVWENIIRKENFSLIHTMGFSEKWDGSEIMVNGEGGDQIHGTDLYRPLRKRYGETSMSIPWSRSIIVDHIQWKATALSPAEVEILADILIDQVSKAPIDIETLADFWWWINFSCKWSSVNYRLIAKSPRQIDQEFLDSYFFPFYTGKLFQQWSMSRREEKHQGNWETYKWRAKKFIIDTTGCKELELKHRQGSLYTVLTHTNKYRAIDSDLVFYNQITPDEWYEPNNSFKERQ